MSQYYFEKINILIYEEYNFISDILSKILYGFGIQNIHKAKNLIEAQNICLNAYYHGEDRFIDFALVDLVPPSQHGLEFLHWIRHHNIKKIQYMPVIFSTNDSRETIIMSSRDSGANEVILKPYNAHNISNRIAAIINRPRNFIKSDDYSGPSRRRKTMEFRGIDKRTPNNPNIQIINEEHAA